MSTIEESLASMAQGLELMAIAVKKIEDDQILTKDRPSVPEITLVTKAIVTQVASISTHMSTMISLLRHSKATSCEPTEEDTLMGKHTADHLDDQRAMIRTRP